MKVTSFRRYAIEIIDNDKALALLLVYNRLVAYQETGQPIQVDDSQVTTPDISASVRKWTTHRHAYAVPTSTGSVSKIARLMGVEVQ